ncbi:MAG TPA: glycosyltransferase [Stellaceae bacterium]|nr:glycosyltransferase [Stellaceae bacterium]
MSILGVLGRIADIVLVSVLFLQIVLSIRVVRTLVQHIRHRREGMRREREMLAWPLPPDDELPAVLVQIPTYNEGVLIRRVLDAVVALDWPRDRLAVQVLDDSTGASAELARRAVAECQADGHNVTLLQRAERTGFKAGALKLGLEATDQPFIAVFDADYIPPRDFLRQCMRPLLAQPDIAFAQARCDYLNAGQNWLTRAQEIILDSHYAVEQPTRNWTGDFLPFNGTCGIWRREAIAAAGGWHGDTLTEDLDLSYRAQLAGWRAVYLVSVGAPGELPDAFSIWNRQQLRWNKGYAQTARKLLPGIFVRRGLSWHDRFVAFLHLAGVTYGVLMVIGEGAAVIDFLLGTISWSIVIPLAAMGFFLGLAALIGMAFASRTLLGSIGVRRVTEDLGPVLRVALVTSWMHSHAAAQTAFGVLQGLLGADASFLRTPKKGAGLDPKVESSPEVAE